MNGKKKPRIALWGKRSKVSQPVTCHVYGPFEFRTPLGTSILLPGCTSVLKENLNISSSQILPYLYKDAGWYQEDVKNVKEQKGHLSRSIGMFSQRSLFSSFFVFCVWTSGSCRQFVIKNLIIFRWFRTFSLHHNHYLASTVSKSWDNRENRTSHSNWRSDVSLHWALFKFGKPTLKQHIYCLHVQYAERICYSVLKMINKLFCNLSFAGQYMNNYYYSENGSSMKSVVTIIAIYIHDSWPMTIPL